MGLKASAQLSQGSLNDKFEDKIQNFYSIIDKVLYEIAGKNNYNPSFLRLMRQLNVATIVNDLSIFVVATYKNVGGMPRRIWIDWETKPLDIQTAIFLVERDLSFEQSFGFSFDKNIIMMDENMQNIKATEIVENYINQEFANLERINKLVRINPMFQGRDFFIDKNKIFMLSPFSEPFDTIYNDHIRKTVETIPGKHILRADDIYNNKAIIEDIWKNINEAGIIIAELTGKNPNVFYEVGIAHTVGKEVILISQTIEDIPFDLKHLRCILYDYTPRGCQTLELNLKNTILSII